jgi:hypothetical protein
MLRDSARMFADVLYIRRVHRRDSARRKSASSSRG